MIEDSYKLGKLGWAVMRKKESWTLLTAGDG